MSEAALPLSEWTAEREQRHYDVAYSHPNLTSFLEVKFPRSTALDIRASESTSLPLLGDTAQYQDLSSFRILVYRSYGRLANSNTSFVHCVLGCGRSGRSGRSRLNGRFDHFDLFLDR